MLYDYWNYTSCINNENQSLIEASLLNILEKEGFTRVYELPKNFSIDELNANYRKITKQLLKQLWIIGLFPGASGWTIMKTQPNEFMCRRPKNSTKPRLSKLGTKINCKAFHWGVYSSSFGILLEVDEKGGIFVSGCHDVTDKRERNFFYQEKINYGEAWKFHLIDMPAHIIEAIEPTSEEEWERKEARLDELLALREQGLGTFDTFAEEEKLMTSDGIKTDQALRQYIGNSSSYWGMRRMYYKAYTKEEQIKADGGRLLYFQPPEYYHQLDYLSEIAAKY
ncbi:hypothetical protein Sta7437_3528 [Stanieria cyanosphaera PCC 7437]|uniref:Uncharacterized protein n=1 Tax=Stanieria cyanosphaera (strain ATCC 29371 / PCC 7437) TaxID=111780 RepID=K9XY44_STAC7|nr:hypothetical protein [Stanieria cyanosphaera]AFZ37026.1 hypothetical protein Sta7437_3528 [Stanieria cyanosphaera PCC 7437]